MLPEESGLRVSETAFNMEWANWKQRYRAWDYPGRLTPHQPCSGSGGGCPWLCRLTGWGFCSRKTVYPARPGKARLWKLWVGEWRIRGSFLVMFASCHFEVNLTTGPVQFELRKIVLCKIVLSFRVDFSTQRKLTSTKKSGDHVMRTLTCFPWMSRSRPCLPECDVI